MEKKYKHILVIGRIPGDDEDTSIDYLDATIDEAR